MRLNIPQKSPETVFQEKINDVTKSNEGKKSLYDEEAILKSVEKNLEKSLKDEFYEKEFEVNLIGKINFDEVKFNIEKAEITILDEKKVKRVDKVVVGKEKVNKEEKKDSFLEKVEKFVEKELEISHENIIVSYA